MSLLVVCVCACVCTRVRARASDMYHGRQIPKGFIHVRGEKLMYIFICAGLCTILMTNVKDC